MVPKNTTMNIHLVIKSLRSYHLEFLIKNQNQFCRKLVLRKIVKYIPFFSIIKKSSGYFQLLTTWIKFVTGIHFQ